MYDFKNLSHLDFEALVADLLSKEMGLRFELFAKGKDSGIDIRAYTDCPYKTLIVQCKHFANSKFSDLLNKIKNEELPKLKTLKPKQYFIVTSLSLTPANKEALYQVIKDYAQSPQNIYGNEEVNSLLRKHSDIETKHFKLWLSSIPVLEKILHSGIVNLAEIEVRNICNKIKLYVHNESYQQANEILDKHHYVIISGIPGIGKTTLAEILLYDQLQKDVGVIKITENVSEAFVMLKQERPQIFYYDDFLGQTNLSEKLGKNEDQGLLTLIKEVEKSKNKRLILTTREFTLQQAQRTYEKLSDNSIKIGKCVIDLSKYNKQVKAKILYNHLYFSEIPSSFKEELLKDRAYLKIIDHPNYSPRIIEWMVNAHNLQDIKENKYTEFFLSNLDNPEKLWLHAFENQISEAGRYLLATLYSLESNSSFEKLETIFINTTHYKHADFKASLKELEGSFIRTNKEPEYWSGAKETTKIYFQNPSIRDFLKNYMSQTYEYIEHILEKAILFSQISALWGNPVIEYDPPITRNALLNKPNIFIAALQRLSLLPYRSEISRLDTAYENRAFILLDVLVKTKSSEIKELLLSLIERMEYGNISDLENLVDLWRRIERTKKVFLSEEIQQIFCKIRNVFKSPSLSFREYTYLTDFCKESVEYISSNELEEIKNLIFEYDQIIDHEEFKHVDSIEELEEYTGQAEEIEEYWNISLGRTATQIQKRIKTLKVEKEEQEDLDTDDEWRDRKTSTTPTNNAIDEHIADMFNTLKI